MQGLGNDSDFRGVVLLRNSPFVGAEAYYKMSQEACSLTPADVSVPRTPGEYGRGGAIGDFPYLALYYYMLWYLI